MSTFLSVFLSNQRENLDVHVDNQLQSSLEENQLRMPPRLFLVSRRKYPFVYGTEALVYRRVKKSNIKPIIIVRNKQAYTTIYG